MKKCQVMQRHSETQRTKSSMFACMRVCVLRGRGSWVQVFLSSFLFPSFAIFLWCPEDKAPCTFFFYSFVLSRFSFQALSLSSSPGPFSLLPLLRSQFRVNMHTHTYTHLDANIRPTLCLCLRKRSCPAYQSVKATCEARSPAAGRNWLVLSLGDGKMNFPHKDRSTCTAEWPCSGFLVPSIKAVMEFYLRLFHNVFIKHRKRHGCHRSPLQCTAKGLCGVFFCSNFTV